MRTCVRGCGWAVSTAKYLETARWRVVDVLGLVAAARTAALHPADDQVGAFLRTLKARGLWAKFPAGRVPELIAACREAA
jgi:hypothetical protein